MNNKSSQNKKVNNYVDLRNSRGGSQDEIMKKIIEAGEDPFSMENINKYHKQPILFETNGWILTRSQWPYKNTSEHILIITKRYVEKPQDLTDQEFLEIRKCIVWAEENLGISGGGFAMRFGDSILSGSTVKHLHAHIIKPDLEDVDYEKVKVFFGGNKN